MTQKKQTLIYNTGTGAANGLSTPTNFHTIPLNETFGDTITTAFAANQFTLPAGTYSISAMANRYNSQQPMIHLWDITAGAQVNNSMVSSFPGRGGVTQDALTCFQGIVTIATDTTYELRAGTTNTGGTMGSSGNPNYGGNEIFPNVWAHVEITEMTGSDVLIEQFTYDGGTGSVAGASLGPTGATVALNTNYGDTIATAFASNQITLPAGTYLAEAWVNAESSTGAGAFLWNVTDDLKINNAGFSPCNANGTIYGKTLLIKTIFTLASPKTIELKTHNPGGTVGNMGNAVNPTGMNGQTFTNVFAGLKITKF